MDCHPRYLRRWKRITRAMFWLILNYQWQNPSIIFKGTSVNVKIFPDTNAMLWWNEHDSNKYGFCVNWWVSIRKLQNKILYFCNLPFFRVHITSTIQYFYERLWYQRLLGNIAFTHNILINQLSLDKGVHSSFIFLSCCSITTAKWLFYHITWGFDLIERKSTALTALIVMFRSDNGNLLPVDISNTTYSSEY